MKIDCIIPQGGTLKYLRKSVESALNQKDFKFNKIIIFNDGGNEEEFKKALDGLTIDIINSQTSVGAGIARNILVEKSVADYIVFLDHDDILLDDYLKTIIPYLDSNYCIQGKRVYIGENEAKHGVKVLIKILPSGFCVKKSTFNKTRGFPSCCSEDLLFFAELEKYSSIKTIDKTLSLYRIHNAMQCQTKYDELLYCYLQLNAYINKTKTGEEITNDYLNNNWRENKSLRRKLTGIKNRAKIQAFYASYLNNNKINIITSLLIPLIITTIVSPFVTLRFIKHILSK